MTDQTIPVEVTEIEYAPTSPQTVFTIPFQFFLDEDIRVSIDDGVDTTELSNPAGFSVAGVAIDGGFDGGDITLVASIDDGETVKIFRDVAINRLTNFPGTGPFNIGQLNTELNKIFAILQNIETRQTKTLSLPDSALDSTPWDAGGRAFINALQSGDPTSLVLQSQLSGLGAINARIFAQDAEPDVPAGGFNVGDLWFDTNDGNHPYTWGGSAFVSRRDGTIAGAQATADQGIIDAAGALGVADGKIVSFFQNDPPVDADHPDLLLQEGDLWFDTDDNNNTWRWNDTTNQWVDIADLDILDALSDAAAAQATADGKIITFIQDNAPTGEGEAVGDLWFDSDDNNREYRYNGTSWISVQDGGTLSVFATISKSTFIVPTDGNGDNKDFSQANGTWLVLKGLVDETANATYSIISSVGLTAELNTSVDEFFTGPIGAYRVTASSLTTTKLTMRAVFDGVTTDIDVTYAETLAPLGLSIAPSSDNNFETVCPVSSVAFAASASGGKPSYSFAWDFSAGGAGLTINSPSSSSTTVTRSGTGAGQATLRCTVTDNDSNQAIATATVTLECGT